MAKREDAGLSDRHEQVMEKTSSKSRELKKELQSLVKEIIGATGDGEMIDCEAEGCEQFKIAKVDKAIQTLNNLKKLKLNREQSPASQLDDLVIPEEYRCPISKELMRDPVILATGQTYDRVFIHGWLKGGNRVCPQTQQVLPHTVLTPNHLVRKLIAQWCEEHGIELPPPDIDSPDEGAMTDADRNRLNELLAKLSSSGKEQREAAKELRTLTKKMPSFRSLFGESKDALPRLLGPLRAGPLGVDPALQEDLVTTVLNLSIPERNKKIVAEHPLVIPMLIGSLSHGTIDTRKNAAAALFTLAVLDSNQPLMEDAVRPLIDLLGEDHTLAVKDAASALYKLCATVEIREKVIQEGAVGVLMEKIKDGVLVDELLVVLALLSTHDKAITEMVEHGAVACLLRIISESRPHKTKENSVATLYSIIARHRPSLKEIREDEKANGTLSFLEEHGNERAKRKAKSILNRLHRSYNLTHTA